MRCLLTLPFLIACEPFGPGGDPIEPPDGGQGRLHLSTDSLNFGDVSVANQGTTSLSFEVRNTGTGLLKIAGLDRPIGDPTQFSTNAPALLELEANQFESLTVWFTPTGSGAAMATLLPNGQSAIELNGRGLAPALSVNPALPSFGSEPVGCSAQQQILLTNTGEEDLRINEAEISGSPAFQVDVETPMDLAPGASDSAIVVFAPSSGNLHESVLQIQSNDPLHPVQALSLAAVGYEGQRVQEQFNYFPTGRTALLLVVNERANVISEANSSALVFQNFLADLEGLEWRVALSTMSSACTATSDPWMDWQDNANDVASALANGFGPPGIGSPMLFNKTLSLLERSDEGDCMEGFLQDDALLHIGLISDQPETSSGTVSNNLAAMEAQLNANQELEVFSLSSTGANGCPNTPRLVSAANASQGLHFDLCTESLEAFLKGISDRAILERNTKVTIELAEVPVVSTLSVTTDSHTLQAWHYISTDNALVIDGLVEGLTEGQTLQVEYLAAVECE